MSSPTPTVTGSSPPTRGTLSTINVNAGNFRLIPAHAGNTALESEAPMDGSAHPRPRGEHLYLPAELKPFPGSSPPTRGTQRMNQEFDHAGRLIPAHAGNTTRRPGPRRRSPAHPRPRGEHGTATSFPSTRIGSSPPTRGTRSCAPESSPGCRLIPAHAGNTVADLGRPRRAPAHPRPRGEHRSAPCPAAATSGSSPPTRGTRGTQRPRCSGGGLIPAHAGNTPPSS